MAAAYDVVVSPKAQREARGLSDRVAEAFGDAYGDSVNRRIVAAIDSLDRMPTRFTRVRHLMGRRYVYRRVLVGRAHRVIFTVDEAARRVEVVRVDLQRSDPASLDDLP